jgi:hypothetical protein
MKLRTQHEGLAVRATVATVEPKDTIMTITGNRTVGKAGSNANPIGRLVVPPKTAGGIGTVETRFKELVDGVIWNGTGGVGTAEVLTY